MSCHHNFLWDTIRKTFGDFYSGVQTIARRSDKIKITSRNEGRRTEIDSTAYFSFGNLAPGQTIHRTDRPVAQFILDSRILASLSISPGWFDSSAVILISWPSGKRWESVVNILPKWSFIRNRTWTEYRVRKKNLKLIQIFDFHWTSRKKKWQVKASSFLNREYC